MVQDIGPLFIIALALFGPTSYIADRVTHPDLYVDASQKNEILAPCVEQVPFTSLTFRSRYGDHQGLHSVRQQQPAEFHGRPI